jgi:hypothetical protein
MLQDYMIYKDGDSVKVRGIITGTDEKSAESAGEAIQFAVDRLAETGGDITLGSGVYVLDDPIKLASDVSLRGRGRSTKLIVGQKNASGIGILSEGCHGVDVSDLAVMAGEDTAACAGVVLDASGDCKVRNVFSAGFAGYGIWVRNKSFLSEIRGCSLAGNKKAGILIEEMDRGKYGDFIPNLVTNCIIYGGGKGIETKRATVLNIVGCVVYQTGDVGYHIHNTSNSVLISGCRTFQITGPAVLVEDAHEFNLSSNIFCWHTGHGIEVKNTRWGTITGNEIIDTGSYNTGVKNFTGKLSDLPADMPHQTGIVLSHTRGYSVTGNTIFNWSVCPKMRYGIHEDSESYNNTITGNNVNYFQEAAVLSEGKNTTVDNNVGYGDQPYDHVPDAGWTLQTFQRELTDLFISEQVPKGGM